MGFRRERQHHLILLTKMPRRARRTMERCSSSGTLLGEESIQPSLTGLCNLSPIPPGSSCRASFNRACRRFTSQRLNALVSSSPEYAPSSDLLHSGADLGAQNQTAVTEDLCHLTRPTGW